MAIIDTGNTAWMLISTVLVLLMTIPGIALFYGGLTKRKNVLNTIFLSLIAFAIATIIWVTYGYQMAFGTTLNGIIGIPTNLLLSGITPATLSGSIPEILFIVFQLVFAGLAAAIISGSIVERMKTSSWIIFIIAWITLIYIPIAHWVWGGGWLMQLGALDFAGGTVIHINAGISALILALILGKRKDSRLLPHNVTLTVIGGAFLWFGWMGFNGGSALAANGIASYAIIVSIVASAAALITWVAIEAKKGKPTVVGAISGAIAGLVGITPAAGFVDITGAIIIGIISAIISYYAISYLKSKLGYDDALDVMGIHGFSGIWGAIATGIFAVPYINNAGIGLIAGNPGQVTIQIISVIATIAYSATITYIIAKIIDKTIGLRTDEKTEIEGLDINLHEESGYKF